MKIPFRIHLSTPGLASVTCCFRAADLVEAAQFYREYMPPRGWGKIGFSFDGRYHAPFGAALLAGKGRPRSRPPVPDYAPIWLLEAFMGANRA